MKKDLQFNFRANANTIEMLNELAKSKNVDRTNYLTNMIIDEYSKFKTEHEFNKSKIERLNKFAKQFPETSEESKF